MNAYVTVVYYVFDSPIPTSTTRHAITCISVESAQSVMAELISTMGDKLDDVFILD